MNSSTMLKKYLKRPPKPFNSIIENGDKEDFFEGLDIDKPESLMPTDMELRIQADRVMFSIKKAISVLTVMAHMPFLMADDARLIRQNFSRAEVNFILTIMKKYDPSYENMDEDLHYVGELYDIINKIKISKGKGKILESDLAITDPNLSQVIHMIFTNKCIRQEIKNAVHPVRNHYIVEFIRVMEELQAVANLKLYVTGTEEEARDRRLRQAYKSNIMLTAAITDLEQQLQNQREQLGNELNQKVATFDKYNNKMVGIKEEFQISIEKNIHESEKRMMHQCLESEERQALLVVESEAVTKQYEVLLVDHLDEEKKLRTKRTKTETQLQNWLTKYDQDIGDKQIEYDELKKEYDTEKEALDDLDDKMDEQEKEYNILMEEKREEEERLHQEMAYRLLMNRSAKIIQRAWRSYRERRAKRRGKKGKKGKDAKKRKYDFLIHYLILSTILSIIMYHCKKSADVLNFNVITLEWKQNTAVQPRLTRVDDPSAVLQSKFKGDVFEEMKPM